VNGHMEGAQRLQTTCRWQVAQDLRHCSHIAHVHVLRTPQLQDERARRHCGLVVLGTQRQCQQPSDKRNRHLIPVHAYALRTFTEILIVPYKTSTPASLNLQPSTLNPSPPPLYLNPQPSTLPPPNPSTPIKISPVF
jgi:hypothetical protein